MKLAIKNKLRALRQNTINFLSGILPYRGYAIDFGPQADPSERTGSGYIKAARETQLLTIGQIDRAFSKNY
jgi:hypothetical protein